MSGFEPLARSARPLPRRAVLATSGTAVLAAAAACSSGGTPTGSTTASPPGTSSASSSASGQGSRSASAPAAATADPPTTTAGTPDVPESTAEAAPDGPVLASVAEVQAAGAAVVGDAASPYLLAYSGGTVVAHTAICTHQGCTVAASGQCPCHGSRFDVATGAVLGGPAVRPLEELPVTVSGGQVYAG